MAEIRKLHIVLLAALAFFFLIDILDFMTSILIVSSGLWENNVVAVYVIDAFGLYLGLGILKMASLTIIASTVVLIIRSNSLLDDEFAIGVLAFLNLVGVVVLWNNFALIM